MTENCKSLVHYDMSKQSEKLIIGAKVDLPMFNRVVMLIITPGYVLFVLWLIYIAITENAPIWFYLFIVGVIVLSVIFGKGIFNLSKHNRNWQLIVDKDNNFVECPNENFRTKTENVKNVSLVDIHTIFTGIFAGTALGLKFSTDAGDKILMFPVDSYERGEELITTIKSYLS